MTKLFAYYTEKNASKGEIISLSKQESHHLLKVRRVCKNDDTILLNGKGTKIHCDLIDPNPKEARFEVQKIESIEKKLPKIVLLQALPKGKVMDSIVRKATEIGVDIICPITTERTEVKKSSWQAKINKWEAIAIEACKQSGNPFLPEIQNVTTLSEACNAWKNQNSFKLLADTKGAQNLNFYLEKHFANSNCNYEYCIWLIGPEGDFSEQENNLIAKAQFLPVKLANNILKVETAAIYALSILDHALQGFEDN